LLSRIETQRSLPVPLIPPLSLQQPLSKAGFTPLKVSN
jgi:hypothetical protein